jgi:ABC-2 type transport system ATP-binding protein
VSAVIECARLTKRYPTATLALDGLDLEIATGTSFGLVGENGAGKTTFVRLVMGFIFPTAGRLAVLGQAHVARAHRHIGYVHERQFTDLYLTGRQYLTYMAELSDLWGRTRRARVDAGLELTGMSSAADRRLRTYSKGMLQRLAIAQALLAQPDLVILDEPTSGLDPPNQREVRDVISRMHREGTTVVLCSHNLPEVEELCDTVGILHQGRLLRAGTLEALRVSPTLAEIVVNTPEPVGELIARLGLGHAVVEAHDHSLRIELSKQVPAMQALLAAGVPLRSLNPVEESLETIYLRETQWPGRTA